jgi:hypothetical protein
MPSSFTLMLMMGPKIAVPVPQAITDALTSVSVTVSSGQASGFQLSFAVSKNSVINQMLIPAGFFDPGIRVIIVVIMNGTPHVLMDGIITRQDLTQANEPGASTLNITGEDLSLLMNLKAVSMCYPALTAEARVAVICLNYLIYGMIPVPVPTLLVDVPNPIDKIPVQPGMTDLAYLKALADEVGYVFYVEPGPVPGTNIAYWGPQIRVGLPQPALSVNMDAETNVESMSFSFDGLSRTQLTVAIQEPFTKISISIPIPDIGLLRPPLAARPAIALREEPLDESAALNPIQAALLGMSRSATASDAITAQGKLDVLRYGHILKARQLVSVRGAGVAYDGFYYVNSVTHEIKRGEYKQSFQLARDGLISLSPLVPVGELVPG